MTYLITVVYSHL